jgi:arylsulfatase A-like enzyme
MLGIDKSEGIDGMSLVSLMKGKTKKGRDFIFFDDNLFGEYFIRKSRRKLGLRHKNYKYIKTLVGADVDLFRPIPENTRVSGKELYDLREDPEEENNIYVKNNRISVRLERMLERKIEELDLATRNINKS